MNRRIEELEKIVHDSNNSLYEVAIKIYDMLSQLPEGQGELIQYLFEEYDVRESKIIVNGNDSPELSNKLKNLQEEQGDVVNQMLWMLIKRTPSEWDFYNCLWGEIINNPILIDRDSKAFALYYVWIDKQVPYYTLEAGFTMSDDEYRFKIDTMRPIIKKMRYSIYTCAYDQRTQRAGALYNLMNSLADDNEKIIFLSRVIAEYERSILEVLHKNDK